MRAFTLIELLVVVLILAILMAVAMPMYLSAVADSQKKSCRANMQTIANAEQAYKVRSSAHAYVAISAGADMVAAGLTDLMATPKCPSGGQYSVLLSGTTADGRSVPANGLAVQCNYGTTTHGSFIPGLDSE